MILMIIMIMIVMIMTDDDDDNDCVNDNDSDNSEYDGWNVTLPPSWSRGKTPLSGGLIWFRLPPNASMDLLWYCW